jgi:hypothetical protein
MSGKKDSTGYTAAGGVTDVEAPGPTPAQPRRSAIASEPRLHLVRSDGDGETSMRSRPARPAKGTGMLDRSLQERIGAILRESFADIEEEPLPERLSNLIEALHREEKRR